MSDLKNTLPTNNMVSLLIVNKTQDKIYSQLEKNRKAIKSFVVYGDETKTLDLKISELENFDLVFLSPPYPRLPLKMDAKTYEVP